MESRQYYLSIIANAWENTRQFVLKHIALEVFLVLSGTGYGITHKTVLYPLAGLGTFVLGIFLWNLILASFRIHQKQSKVIQTLEKQLPDKLQNAFLHHIQEFTSLFLRIVDCCYKGLVVTTIEDLENHIKILQEGNEESETLAEKRYQATTIENALNKARELLKNTKDAEETVEAFNKTLKNLEDFADRYKNPRFILKLSEQSVLFGDTRVKEATDALLWVMSWKTSHQMDDDKADIKDEILKAINQQKRIYISDYLTPPSEDQLLKL